jgi:hypothetical protein
VNKQNLYVTLVNAFIGLLASFLLKANTFICVIAVIVVVTIVFIERKWLYEKIFRNNKWYAAAGYSVLAVVMITGSIFLTQPERDTSQIIKTVNFFLNEIKSGEYDRAWDKLSGISKSYYPLEDFVRDHSNHRININDFRIDEVIINKYDGNKAVAMVSSPISLYGQKTLQLEMIKEENGWRIVFSKEMFKKASPGKRKDGIISGLIRKIF